MDDGTLIDNAYHIMTITASFTGTTPLVLDALNFEGGVADVFGFEPEFGDLGGAVLWIDEESDGHGSLLARNCKFERNRARSSGGAMHLEFNTTLRHCEFEDNLVTNEGGTPQGGAVTVDGGTSELVYARLTAATCTFVNNRALGVGAAGFPPVYGKAQGGAILASGGGDIANCEFRDNQAAVDGLAGAIGGRGGAIYVGDNNSVRDMRVTNCLFAGNSARSLGGAIAVEVGAAVRSCTIVDNEALDSQGGGVLVFGPDHGTNPDTFFYNSIVWANTGGDGKTLDQQVYTDSNGDLIYDHDIIEGADELAAPDFVDAPSDYRLAPGSRGIDEGDNDLLDADITDVNDNSDFTELHPWDLDRTMRVKGGECIVDVGAYEAPLSCPGDLNGDGEVDGADIAIVLGSWGECADVCCPDLDGDSVVGGAEIAIVLGNWGPCPSEFSMMMGEGPSDLDELMELLGVESVEEFTDVLLGLDHESMVTLLEVYLGA